MARVFQKRVDFAGVPIEILGPNPNRKAICFSNDGTFSVELGFDADVGANQGFSVLNVGNVRPEWLLDSDCPGWLQGAIFARGTGAGGRCNIIEISNP